MSRIRKVLVVNKFHYLSGGSERYYFSILEALRRRGIEAIPLSIDYPRTLPDPYRKYFLEPAMKGSETKIEKQKLSLSEQWQVAKNAIYNTKVKPAVRRIVADHRPDIAITVNINNHISPSVVDACVDLGIPVVMRFSDFNVICAANMYYRDEHPCRDCKEGFHHALIHRCVHGSLPKTALAVFANSLHRWMGIYKKVSAFVTPTRFMKKELEDIGFPGDKIYQINTFVNPEPRGAASDSEDPFILFAGRFVEYKGADVAVEAFAKAGLKGVSLKLVGDERDRDSERLHALTSRLGVPHVQFLPFQAKKESVVEMIQKSLFTLVPSQWYENLPHAILESFSCGRAVVATRLGSIPEIVRDGKNGLLFEYGNVADFAEKIKTLFNRKEVCRAMGERARETVVRDYSESQHMDRLLEVFEKCLS